MSGRLCDKAELSLNKLGFLKQRDPSERIGKLERLGA